jgi:hypothetical protein
MAALNWRTESTVPLKLCRCQFSLLTLSNTRHSWSQVPGFRPQHHWPPARRRWAWGKAEILKTERLKCGMQDRKGTHLRATPRGRWRFDRIAPITILSDEIVGKEKFHHPR